MMLKRFYTVALGFSILAVSQPLLAAIDFATTSVSALETDGTATLAVTRTGVAPNSAASVTIVVTHGTATLGTDYTLDTTTLNWTTAEVGTKTVTVTILPDSETEGLETAHFALTSVTGDTLGSQETTELLIIDPNQSLATDAGLTTEQQSAAEVLDNVCAGAGSSIEGCSLLELLSDSEQAQALESILPRAVSQQAANTAVAQAGNTQAVRQRMQNVRAGNVNPLAGLNLQSGDKSVSLAGLLERDGEPYRGGNAGEDGIGERWGIFLSGQLQSADQDSTTEILGYQSDSQQITGGADYRFGTNLFVGMALSFSQTETDSNADAGSQDSNVTILNIFGSYYATEHWYIDGVMSYGSASYDMERNFQFGGTVSRADSATDGSQFGISISTGYELSMGAWLMDSYARAELNKTTIDAYTESGGAGLGLSLDEQTVDSARAIFGGSLAWVHSVSYGVWIPKATAEWVHEMKDDSRDIVARFASNEQAGSFSIATVDPDRDYFNVGGSITGTFTHGRSAFVRYEVLVGRDNYIAETLEMGVRMAF